jgi:protein-disulfide isomerase
MDQRANPLLTLPGAIIIGCAIIAIAIIWTNKPAAPSDSSAIGELKPSTEINLAPVTAADHILGNPNAPIIIVEYSDSSCPFCKIFHPTMKRIMDEYGASGDVAWVYRHFPLDKADENGFILHPNAGKEAEAMECAAKIGGNEKFWAYTNRLYEVTPSVTQATPGGLDQKQLPVIASDVGLDVSSFNECLSSGQFKSKVEAQYIDGLNAGVSGTPYSVILSPTGGKIPLMGAQPYATVKASIEALLADKK